MDVGEVGEVRRRRVVTIQWLRPAGVVAAVLGMALMGGSSVAIAATSTPSPAPTSAIGKASVFSIAVSPNYLHTGLVAVSAASLSQGTGSGTHLWVSHDGGAHWAIAAAKGWNQGRPVIASDGKGHDVIYAISMDSLQKSTDGGQTWQSAAAGGLSAIPAPTYPKDGTLAVTAKQDYVSNDQGTHNVDGSSGAYTDFAFAFPSTFPSGGAHSPALLGAIDNSTHLPIVQRCDASLRCTGASTLPGATSQSSPATVMPSPHYQQDGAVFVQTGKGIYKSTDGGVTFAPLAVAPSGGSTTQATPGLALSPGYDEQGANRTAYAAVLQVYEDMKAPRTAGGIYRTVDGGTTWQSASGGSLLDGGATSVVAAPDGRLFAGFMRLVGGVADAGLLCSTDGTSWKVSCPPVGDAASATGQGNKAPTSAGSQGTCTASGCPTPGSASSGTAGAAGSNGTGSSLDGSQAVRAPLGKSTGSGMRVLLIPAAILLAAVVAGLAVRRRVRGSASAT